MTDELVLDNEYPLEHCPNCREMRVIAVNNREIKCTLCFQVIRIIPQTRQGPIVNRTDF